AAFPYDQHALALQATAWRILGDPRYAGLYDYGAFVRPYVLPTPDGWPDLDSFLVAVRARLGQMHDLETHPLQQSLRGGAQVQSLHSSPEPLFQAFFASARATVERYAAEIGEGSDPLRVRRTGAAAIQGGWSVSLKPNGFHTDHVHPQGWVSSAFYIDLPPGVDDAGKREGWIKFGQPGCATAPKLEAEHGVKPAPGTLVLFPSYMWHGTIPFTGDQRRLTMAFDAVPA
ncbi:MAG: putative 2OG-Fe(II) oxygenase, partial [Caulobacter sp.]